MSRLVVTLYDHAILYKYSKCWLSCRASRIYLRICFFLFIRTTEIDAISQIFISIKYLHLTWKYLCDIKRFVQPECVCTYMHRACRYQWIINVFNSISGYLSAFVINFPKFMVKSQKSHWNTFSNVLCLICST